MSTQVISKRFAFPDSDLTLESVDGVLFKVHRKNLEMSSQAFADAASSTSSPPSETERLDMQEDSQVIELMLQYMYLQRQPDLKRVPWKTMKELAEAVEKYQVYSAMGVCNIQMRENISSHAIDVLLFSVRHKHDDLIDEAGIATIEQGMSPTAMFRELPLDVYGEWIRYHAEFSNLLHKEFERFPPSRHHTTQQSVVAQSWPSLASPTTTSCPYWTESYALISHSLSGSLLPQAAKPTKASEHFLKSLGPLLERRQALVNGKCDDCRRELGYWQHQHMRDRREIQGFSHFV